MKALAILRCLSGLGRVVSGFAIMETLRDEYTYAIEIISYLQGNIFLEERGYQNLKEVVPMDYCSIGLLPTNKMANHIHERIQSFEPDIVLVDGEPLMVQALRISYPNIKIVVLLNPSDVDNPHNDKEAMKFFNAMYAVADLAVVHGLRLVDGSFNYKKLVSVGTILRKEIFSITNIRTNNIYCLLGGGTVNVGHQFSESTIKIATLCQKAASLLPDYNMHIVCSSQNIYDAINENSSSPNVIMHKNILDAVECYSNSCLVITRSGRNTLSELAYLGIPTISFVSGCSYRKAEQEQNIENIRESNICLASMDISSKELAEKCLAQIQKVKVCHDFCVGNISAIKEIVNL